MGGGVGLLSRFVLNSFSMESSDTMMQRHFKELIREPVILKLKKLIIFGSRKSVYPIHILGGLKATWSILLCIVRAGFTSVVPRGSRI